MATQTPPPIDQLPLDAGLTAVTEKLNEVIDAFNTRGQAVDELSPGARSQLQRTVEQQQIDSPTPPSSPWLNSATLALTVGLDTTAS